MIFEMAFVFCLYRCVTSLMICFRRQIRYASLLLLLLEVGRCLLHMHSFSYSQCWKMFDFVYITRASIHLSTDISVIYICLSIIYLSVWKNYTTGTIVLLNECDWGQWDPHMTSFRKISYCFWKYKSKTPRVT